LFTTINTILYKQYTEIKLLPLFKKCIHETGKRLVWVELIMGSGKVVHTTNSTLRRQRWEDLEFKANLGLNS
jgi:hypothetical protein